MKPNEQDAGPFRADQLVAVWPRVSRAIDALHDVGFIDCSADVLRYAIDVVASRGVELVDDHRLTKALRLLALQEGMHAADWLRMKAVEADMPRRKPPAAVELQLRLRGLNCTRLIAQKVKREDEPDAFRVSIRTTRGDVASCDSTSFANALDGAIAMAGARQEGDSE